jgi:hypothetical protein
MLVGLFAFARLRSNVTARVAARSYVSVAAVMAFACSVYEAPGVSSSSVEDGGTDVGAAGAGATAGASTSGAPAAGTGGNPTTNAGSSSGATAGTAGTAGDPAIDPTNGGEGGAPAVIDECPADPDKLAPGACGCGVPEAPSVTHSDCDTLESLLVHRYDFEGTGTAVKDRVGTAHGVVARGSTLSKLDGKGVVLLGGGDVGSYVDLPNGLISSLKNATIEAWITWGGGTNWQRIFDFGDSTSPTPEDHQLDGKTYLFVTPKSGSSVVSVGFSVASVAQELDVPGSAPLAMSLSQVVVVADDDGDKLALYVNGAKLNEQAWTGQLSKINDVNVWLGRSQYANDSELNAVYHEFRVYGAALSEAQVAAAYAAGTDPKFLAY